MHDQSGTRQPSGPGEKDVASGSSAKKRKPRARFSCNDCRRLKLKCDPAVPCSHCVRRNCVDKCIEDSQGRTLLPAGDSSSTRRRSETGASSSPDPDEERIDDTRHHSSQNNVGGHTHPNQIFEAPVPLISGSDTRGSEQQNLSFSGLQPSLGIPPNISASTDGSSTQPTSAQQQSNNGNTSANVNVNAFPGDRSAQWNASRPQQPNQANNAGFGTLVLNQDGSSRYLGHTAGSEWLRDSETQDLVDTASPSRAPSPGVHQVGFHNAQTGISVQSIAFPFNSAPSSIRTSELLGHLPPKEEGQTLVDSYYRYCSWHHDVAPKTSFQKTFERVYAGLHTRQANAQEIALVYIIMAHGTLFNLEMPNVDPSAEDHVKIAERALVKGRFMANNTIAGVQTLHLMAHYHLHVDKGNRGDQAWTLWGVCMRMIQAMGMHRDGARWNLPQEVVEERRKVFWECNAADVMQAHCFSRPYAINPEHCDTSFPSEACSPTGEKPYTILRFELSQISAEILDVASKVRPPEYSVITGLHTKICAFEAALPYSIRCRAAHLAMPSRFPDAGDARAAAPEPSKRSVGMSFQQNSLALNICETIIWLHRPYYAKALYVENDRREISMYGQSYLAVIERCAAIIAIVDDIYNRFPSVSTRQWHLWYHVFNSAVCLGTLIIKDSQNALAGYALDQITTATRLYTLLAQTPGPSPRVVKNLQWLLKLQSRAAAKMASPQSGPQGKKSGDGAVGTSGSDGAESGNEGEDVELLGWRTRLVERANQKQKAKTIHSPVSPINEPSAADTAQLMASLFEASGTGGPTGIYPTEASTDSLLRDFWDPMILQTQFGASATSNEPTNLPFDMNVNWWDTGPSLFET